MKKLFLIMTMASLLCLATVSSVAAADMTAPVGLRYVPHAAAKPTFDGNVTEAEWGGAVKITVNDTNAKAVWQQGYAEVPLTHAIDVYLMWDESFLYVAYDVTDPTTTPWTEWKFNNGDAIQLFVDVGPSLAGIDLNDRATIGSNRAPLFASGAQLTEEGAVGAPLWLHQCVVSESVITDYELAPAAAGVNDQGWTFECGIPWSVLFTDMADKAGVTIESVGSGTELSLLLVYLDYNANRALVNAFGTNKTGYDMPFDWIPDEHGIELILLGEGETAPETEAPPVTTEPETTPEATETTPAATEDDTTPAVTETKEDTTKADDTTPAVTDAPADDTGGSPVLPIVIAIVAVAVIAVVVIVVLKKKK